MTTVEVSCIDKIAPIATVSYNITDRTNQNVIATLIDESEEIEITNNEGKNTYTFTENGEFTFEFVDKAGNKGTAKAEVTWIEAEEEPDTPSFNVSLETSKKSLNPGEQFEVSVNLNNMKNFKKGLMALTGKFEYDKEKLEMIDILGENSWNLDKNSFNDNNFRFVTESNNYVLEEETIFKIIVKVKETIEVPTEVIFKLVSIEGSNGEKDIFADDSQLSVNIIENQQEEAKITSEIYEIEAPYISKIEKETTVVEFKQNVEANREITIIDNNGNELEDDDIIGTGMTIKVGEELEYTLIVMGDINGDGKVTITDIAKIKLHIIKKEILTGTKFIAADLNNDKELTITDLARIKIIFLGIPLVQ